ncbi:hypothetical protein, partial [Allomesorhizobium alhagi]
IRPLGTVDLQLADETSRHARQRMVYQGIFPRNLKLEINHGGTEIVWTSWSGSLESDANW